MIVFLDVFLGVLELVFWMSVQGLLELVFGSCRGFLKACILDIMSVLGLLELIL